MMVELPAVVETMAEFAAQADFFAIGTNDFVQYMLGVDRSNKRVADTTGPSIRRCCGRWNGWSGSPGIIGKPISVCGEMGHDAAMIPFLLGIGIRRLSLDPQFMPAVHQRISDLDHRSLPGSRPVTDGRRQHRFGVHRKILADF
jgi:phosphotransferase system enzyme I (PtsP)